MIMSGHAEGSGSFPRRNSIVEFMRSILEDAESDDDSTNDMDTDAAAAPEAAFAAAGTTSAAAFPTNGDVEPSLLLSQQQQQQQQRKRTRAPMAGHEYGTGSLSHIDASLFADVSPEELDRWLMEADAEQQRKHPAASTATSYSARVADIRRATAQLRDVGGGGGAISSASAQAGSSFAPTAHARLAQHDFSAFGADAVSAYASSSKAARRAGSLDLSLRDAAAAPAPAAAAPGSTEAELQNLPEERQYQQLVTQQQQIYNSSLPNLRAQHRESGDAKRRRMMLGRKAESERVLGSGPMSERQAADLMTQGHYSADAVMQQFPFRESHSSSAQRQQHLGVGNLSPIPQSPFRMMGLSPMTDQFGQMHQQQLHQQLHQRQEMMQAVPPPPFAPGGFEQHASGAPPLHPAFAAASHQPLAPHKPKPSVAYQTNHPAIALSPPSAWGGEKSDKSSSTVITALQPPSSTSVPATGLCSSMQASQESQQSIHDWDRSMGLRRSHSKTMRASSRSRKKLLEMQAMHDMVGMNLVLNEHRAKTA